MLLGGGLAVQRPVKRAIEQDDERVRKWKLEEFVAAVAEAVEVDRKRRKQIPDVQEAKQLMGKLTKREVQILRLLSRGLLNQEVASALRISQRTVEAHRASIYHKVGKKSIAQISEMLMIAS